MHWQTLSICIGPVKICLLVSQISRELWGHDIMAVFHIIPGALALFQPKGVGHHPKIVTWGHGAIHKKRKFPGILISSFLWTFYRNPNIQEVLFHPLRYLRFVHSLGNLLMFFLRNICAARQCKHPFIPIIFHKTAFIWKDIKLDQKQQVLLKKFVSKDFYYFWFSLPFPSPLVLSLIPPISPSFLPNCFYVS